MPDIYICIHIYEKSAILLTSVGEEFLCRARKWWQGPIHCSSYRAQRYPLLAHASLLRLFFDVFVWKRGEFCRACQALSGKYLHNAIFEASVTHTLTLVVRSFQTLPTNIIKKILAEFHLAVHSPICQSIKLNSPPPHQILQPYSAYNYIVQTQLNWDSKNSLTQMEEYWFSSMTTSAQWSDFIYSGLFLTLVGLCDVMYKLQA